VCCSKNSCESSLTACSSRIGPLEEERENIDLKKKDRNEMGGTGRTRETALLKPFKEGTERAGREALGDGWDRTFGSRSANTNRGDREAIRLARRTRNRRGV